MSANPTDEDITGEDSPETPVDSADAIADAVKQACTDDQSLDVSAGDAPTDDIAGQLATEKDRVLRL